MALRSIGLDSWLSLASVVIAAIALLFTALARRDAKASARQAERQAAEGAALGQRMTVAIETIATVAARRAQPSQTQPSQTQPPRTQPPRTQPPADWYPPARETPTSTPVEETDEEPAEPAREPATREPATFESPWSAGPAPAAPAQPQSGAATGAPQQGGLYSPVAAGAASAFAVPSPERSVDLPVAWVIEHHVGSDYVLRNLGYETARGVAMAVPSTAVFGGVPRGVDIAPFASHRFTVSPTALPLPTHVEVSWLTPSPGRDYVPFPVD